MKKAWDKLTMALGLWLIGGRETPRAEFWRSHYELESRNTAASIAGKSSAIIQRDQAIRERDQATWNAQVLKNDIEDAEAMRDGWISEAERLDKLLKSARKRHAKLKAQVKRGGK